MGNYYSLWFKGTVKEKYRKNFESIGLEGEWEFSPIPSFREFAQKDSRAGFIPCGALACAPESWETPSGESTDGFERSYDSHTGYWVFQCSVKTLCTIKSFFEMVPEFMESIEYSEWSYEENDFATIITMGKDGNMEEACVDYDRWDNSKSLYRLWQKNGLQSLLEQDGNYNNLAY